MAEQYTPKDFKSNQEIRWCPGCGDHGIINSVQKAMAEVWGTQRVVGSNFRNWMFFPFPLLHEYLWFSYDSWPGCCYCIRS